MERPKVEIIADQNNIHTKVIFDGKDISSNVKAIGFKQKAGYPPELTIDFIGCDISLTDEFRPPLPEVFLPYYQNKEEAE